MNDTERVFNREKEEELWFDIYVTFNDDNMNHAENAFVANGFIDASAESLHEENARFLQEVMEHGVSKDIIIKLLPSAKDYLN